MLWHLWSPTWLSSAATPRVERAAPALETMLIQSLLKHGTTAACVLDAHGQCLQMTPNFESVTGLEISQCYQHGLFNHLSDDDQTALAQACETTLATQQSSQWILETATDAPRMQEWTLMPHTEVAGQILMLVRDVTEAHMAEKQAQQAALQAQLADKQRSDFLANMSHELRTPLNAILGFAQMMDYQVFGRIANPTYRDYISKIQESGHELLQKINDLLHIASLDIKQDNHSATAASQQTTFCVNTMLRELVENVSHNAFQKDMHIQPVLLDTAPQLTGDRLQIKQALLHVLNNAVKYGKPSSQVRLVCRADKDGSLTMQCTDHGIGITPKYLQQIMAGLQRPLLERGREDIGLGLAVSNHYLQLHQTSLHIQSKHGMGTTVTLHFPAERVQWNRPASTGKPMKALEARPAPQKRVAATH